MKICVANGTFVQNRLWFFQAELIATCQTNIKCLGVISETLDSGENLANVTQDDLEQVHGKLNVTTDVAKYFLLQIDNL